MQQPKPESERVQIDQRIQEEALRVAKSIQVPGQSKEQTRLIAKGIEKGIALYKQQQSAKARERDKARKRAGKPLPAPQAQTLDDDSFSGDEIQASPVKAALWMAGALFALVGLLNLLRFILGWQFQIESFDIPLTWSLAVAVLMVGLASWMFWSTRDL